MKTFLCLCIFLVAAMTASAADITGKWSGSFVLQAPDGEHADNAFVIIQQKGTELTGSGGPDESRQWPMQNGKIEGDKITFEVTADGPVYKIEAKLEGDHIKGNVTAKTPEGETLTAKMDLTRVK